uniref:CelEx-BR15 n=1 Tax=uncultured organism TaxID=155900 RepID=N0CFU5_9ZZZZ|nr:CelEx-BR15 [uncultured organism]
MRVASIPSDPVHPCEGKLAAGTYHSECTCPTGAILHSCDPLPSYARWMLAYVLGGDMPGQGPGERLVVDPNRSSVLYVAAPSGNGLWRSTDSGVTWSKVTSFPNPGNFVQDPTDPNGYLTDNQGVYWVTFDKRTGTPGNTTQTIYTGVADLGTSIYRSTNGGATWSRIWDWTRYPNRSFRYTLDVTAAPWLKFPTTPLCGGGRPGAEVNPKLGWMTETLEIDPFNSNRFMYGTGATLFGSTNLTTWDVSTTSQIAIRVMAQGIEETAVQDLISPPAGAPLISALRDITGFRHNNVDVVPAAQMQPVRGSSVSLDYAELSPSYIVRAANGDTANCEKSLAISTDGGTTWAAVSSQPSGLTGGGSVAVSATGGGKIVWSPAGVGLFFTTGGGKTWTTSTGIPAGARVASDRVNPGKFYGFKSGTFYVSTDGGKTFAARATGLPLGGPVRFKAVPGREGDIWLAGGAEWDNTYGLWHSTDSGTSFTKLANIEEADNIGFGKAATGQTYLALYAAAQVAGVRGIFRSINAGQTWVRINDDQHQSGRAGETAITGDPRIFGRVYIGTNGRGIVYGDGQ